MSNSNHSHSSSSPEGMESSVSSSSSSMSSPIVQTWKRRRTLPELLSIRQTYGKSSSVAAARRRVPSSLLSYRGAWNPSRLQNMILAVGPGTPASLVRNPPSSARLSSSSSSSAGDSSDSENDEMAEEEEQSANDEEANMEEDDDEEEDVEIEEIRPQSRARWTRQQRDNEDDDDDDDEDDDGAQDPRQVAENALLEWYAADEGSENSGEEGEVTTTTATTPVPSMRHGGCINTAAWLDCGWRLSTVGTSSSCEAVLTDDCPTQLVTSGDDHLVKFWDVRHAMGTTSPLAGGAPTVCPFSAPHCPDQDETRRTWKRHYAKTKSPYLAGSVLPLATLQTGHRGNVFHVTPLHGKPGKVATCGADGFLRLTDLETGNATEVVSPEFEDDTRGLLPAGLLSLRPGMCFSHHFLSQNTGLLCSERGLRRFDLRLPPREQPTQSLLGGPFRNCKACAIWSPPTSTSSLEGGDSAYVFAGGSSADVALCDLRMTDGSSSRVVQHYRPSGLAMADNVSVSGLDLSRDKQELLVSYESDQIYTFPVFPRANSPAGPTVDQLSDLCNNAEGGTVKSLNELAAYGGHLNRFTFLKNAKYAGPRDEYICTGSDSGHAWIYEKSTGAVVSFLNADSSTCNGVIPHPSLPVFVTYGIDSTAKLWRGTIPVDSEVDDSPAGRQKCFHQTEYEMSLTVRKWGEVQQVLKILESEDCEETDVLPDQIPTTKVIMQRGRLGRHFLRGLDGPSGLRIGNDLHKLPETLKQNLYACLRSCIDGDDAPVESEIEALKHRISLIRLRHQADRLGALWNPSIPWALEQRKDERDSESEGTVHPADLVPDSPSDWIPYDPEMSKAPWDFNNYFNTKDYGDFYRQHYYRTEDILPPVESLAEDSTDVASGEGKKNKAKSEDSVVPECDKGPPSKMVSSSEEEEDDGMKYILTVDNLLYETMLLLKDGGNAALRAGELDLAARRYDKAIQYGAVASMSFPVISLDFASGRKKKLKENGGYCLEWGPLIRVLIVSRLNLALLMLRPHFSQPEQTMEQAKLALHDLKPFCIRKGKVMKGTKLTSVFREDEPEETYIEAMMLQAKSFFRLGSAQYELGDYAAATTSYEKSVKSTQQANAKPDNLVLRRLSEAKRENRRKNKRHRKKFKFAFGANENELNG